MTQNVSFGTLNRHFALTKVLTLEISMVILDQLRGVKSFRYISCNKETYFGVDSGNEDTLEMRPLVNIALGRDVITADRDLQSSIQDR